MARGNTPCGGLGGVASGGGRRLLLLAALGCLAVAVRPRIEEVTPESAQPAPDECFTAVLNPSEGRRTYSSKWNSDECSHSQLDAPELKHEAWCAKISDGHQYVIMDLESTWKVAGVVTQGRKNNVDDKKQFVTNFTVTTSMDGADWNTVWKGSVDRNGDNTLKVQTAFAAFVTARYVKVEPKEWERWPSMRLAAVVCTACSQSVFNEGIKRTWSEGYQDCDSSELYSSTAWCAAKVNGNMFVTLDLGFSKRVAGVVTQGRYNTSQMVTAFQVSFSEDNEHFGNAARYEVKTSQIFENDASELSMSSAEAKTLFPLEKIGRFVKVEPLSWTEWPSMRLGALVCEDCRAKMENPTSGSRIHSPAYREAGCEDSQLDSQAAWCAEDPNAPDKYVTMDLGQSRRVVGVVTQGRPKPSEQAVIGFRVSTSEDNSIWTDRVPFFVNMSKATGLHVNSHAKNYFPEVRGRYVKVEAVAWEEYPSMRVAAMVCDDAPPIIMTPP